MRVRIEMDVAPESADALLISDITASVEDAIFWLPGVLNVTVAEVQAEEATVSD